HRAKPRPRTSSLLLTGSGAPRDLPSFPTRRSSDLGLVLGEGGHGLLVAKEVEGDIQGPEPDFRAAIEVVTGVRVVMVEQHVVLEDRKSTRLNSSHVKISYAVFCLKKKKEADARRKD